MSQSIIKLSEGMVVLPPAIRIENNSTEKKYLSIFINIAKTLVFILVALYFSLNIANGTVTLSDQYEDNILSIETEIKKEIEDIKETSYEIPSNDDRLSELVNYYSTKYGINPSIVWLIIKKESNGDSKRIRYEESWKREYSRKYPRGNLNNIEYDLIFSSFGLMQVSYVIWHEFCGINHSTDLLDIETNVECGVKILVKCLAESNNVYPHTQRIRGCFRRYNGSGKKAENYANDLMIKLKDHKIDEKKILSTYNLIKEESKNNV